MSSIFYWQFSQLSAHYAHNEAQVRHTRKRIKRTRWATSTMTITKQWERMKRNQPTGCNVDLERVNICLLSILDLTGKWRLRNQICTSLVVSECKLNHSCRVHIIIHIYVCDFIFFWTNNACKPKSFKYQMRQLKCSVKWLHTRAKKKCENFNKRSVECCTKSMPY